MLKRKELDKEIEANQEALMKKIKGTTKVFLDSNDLQKKGEWNEVIKAFLDEPMFNLYDDKEDLSQKEKIDNKGEEAKNITEECVVGAMDPAYETDDHELDTRGAYSVYWFWGLVLVKGIPINYVLRFSLLNTHLLTFVENIDDFTSIIKINTLQNSSIDMGNTPYAWNQIESVKCPYGNWYHFHNKMDRDQLYTKIWALYDGLGNEGKVKIYLVGKMWPSFELIYFMRKAEKTELYDNYKKLREKEKEEIRDKLKI